MTFDAKRLIYKIYLVKFQIRANWEIKNADCIDGHIGSHGLKKSYYLFCFLFSAFFLN